MHFCIFHATNAVINEWIPPSAGRLAVSRNQEAIQARLGTLVQRGWPTAAAAASRPGDSIRTDHTAAWCTPGWTSFHSHSLVQSISLWSCSDAHNCWLVGGATLIASRLVWAPLNARKENFLFHYLLSTDSGGCWMLHYICLFLPSRCVTYFQGEGRKNGII